MDVVTLQNHSGKKKYN